MPSSLVYIDILQHYPFDTPKLPKDPKVVLRARKTLSSSSQPRLLLKQKINLLKSLKSQLLIALKSVNEEDQSLNLIFEYVPTSFSRFHSQGGEDQTEAMRKQLNVLAKMLTQNSIQHEIRLENIGMDSEKNLKYYLGTNFNINRIMERKVLLKKYTQEIEEVLLEKVSNGFGEQMRKTTHRDICYYSLRTSESIPRNNEEPRWLLRNSQIQGEKRVETLMTKKPERQVKIQFITDSKRTKTQNSQYQELQTSEIKNVKIQDLGTRINKLRLCMKEIIGKTPPKNSGLAHLLVKVDQNNPKSQVIQEDKFYVTPNYTKYEKKIAEFRESRIVKAEKQKEILFKEDKEGYQLKQKHKIEEKTKMIKDIAKTLRDPVQKNRDLMRDGRLSYQVTKTTKSPEIKQPSSPNSETKKKINCFNSGFEDQRKVKQYIAMAEKDKYCEEFMYFLEEQENQEQSDDHKTQAKPKEKGLDSENMKIKVYGPQKSAKHKFSEHISTQCSERGMTELQNKIKSVINNSLKIITHLKARQSIPII